MNEIKARRNCRCVVENEELELGQCVKYFVCCLDGKTDKSVEWLSRNPYLLILRVWILLSVPFQCLQ